MRAKKRKILFKQYEPDSEQLKGMIGQQPLIGPDANIGDTVEARAEEIIDQVNHEVESKELDLANLKPKKQNWDLKRQLEGKLETLERNTESCIQDLIRKRLAATGQLV